MNQANKVDFVKTNNWGVQFRKSQKLDSIFNIKSQEDEGLILKAFFYSSFFLPSVLLEDRKLSISPLYVIPGSEIDSFLDKLDFKVSVDADMTLMSLELAKAVGVSIRYNLVTGASAVVLTLWYGKIPEKQQDIYKDATLRKIKERKE